MNKDSLLEKIKTLLHEAGILDKIISKFIDIVNSEDKDITFGLVLTVVGDNVDLAHEVFEIVKQIEENKKQEFVNKKKVEKNNEVKTIPWKNFNSLADFANNFHIDHSIILKLISDYKLNKNISNEMLNSIYDTDGIKNIVTSDLTLTDEESNLLKDAFKTDLTSFLDCVIANREVTVSDEVLKFKNKKIEENYQLEEQKKEEVTKNMAFELLKNTTSELKNNLDSLLSLDINPKLYEDLLVNYQTLEKNIIHVTKNYIGKKVELTENDNNIYNKANIEFNKTAKFVNLLQEISATLEIQINSLYNLTKNKEKFNLTFEQKEYLALIESKLQAYSNFNYKENKDNQLTDVENIFDYINTINEKIISLVNRFKELVTEQLIADNKTDEFNKIKEMGLNSFVGNDENINKFNLIIELKSLKPVVKNENNEQPKIEDGKPFALKKHIPILTESNTCNSHLLKIPEKAVSILANEGIDYVNNVEDYTNDNEDIKVFVDGIPRESIVDEINKIDTDIADLNGKINNSNLTKEDLQRYQKLIKFKNAQKKALLEKGFIVDNENLDTKKIIEVSKSDDVDSKIFNFINLYNDLKASGVDVMMIINQLNILEKKALEVENELKK